MRTDTEQRAQSLPRKTRALSRRAELFRDNSKSGSFLRRKPAKIKNKNNRSHKKKSMTLNALQYIAAIKRLRDTKRPVIMPMTAQERGYRMNKEPTKTGFEVDVVHARRWYCFTQRAGVCRKAKRQMNRRARHNWMRRLIKDEVL